MIAHEEKRSEPRQGYGTVHEIADYLRVSHMTVYRLMGEGKLSFAKFGRARRILWAEVERFAASCHFGGPGSGC